MPNPWETYHQSCQKVVKPGDKIGYWGLNIGQSDLEIFIQEEIFHMIYNSHTKREYVLHWVMHCQTYQEVPKSDN